MQLFAEFIVVISPALSSETVNVRASFFGGYQNRILAKKNFIPGTYDFLYTITIIHTSFQFLEFITLFSIFYTFQTLLLCFLTVYLSNETTFFKLLGRFSEGQIMFLFDIFSIIQTSSIIFCFLVFKVWVDLSFINSDLNSIFHTFKFNRFNQMILGSEPDLLLFNQNHPLIIINILE